jgi:hypothetical protein
MRVKFLAAAVGLSVTSVVALSTGVSMASRPDNDPVTEPRIETPVEEPVETPAPPAEETPTAPEVIEEAPAPEPDESAVEPEPVAKKPVSPVPTTPPAEEVPAPDDEAPAPTAPEAPTVTPIEAKDVRGPAPKAAKPERQAAPATADPCHMDSYEPVAVASLDGGERARADKVDRNGNGTVCRKDIPGKGRGNTKENSNIKDDHAG